MAGHKRRLLRSLAPAEDRHRVVDVDALAESGPLSLTEAVGKHLEPGVGVAVVTEGLLNYFSRENVERMWRSFSQLMEDRGGIYVSDLHMHDQPHRLVLIRTFTMLLGTFARGSLHLHFEGPDRAAAALSSCGFGGEKRFVRPSDVEGDVPIPIVDGHEYVTILRAEA
jgi:O-methyltransferase involved in polyketide biosynthesis